MSDVFDLEKFNYSALTVAVVPHPRGGELQFWQDPNVPSPGGEPDFQLVLTREALRILAKQIENYLESSD